MTFCAEPDRRQVLAGAVALGAVLASGQTAQAQILTSIQPQLDDAAADQIIGEFLNGATPLTEGLVLELPVLADNPAAVPARIHMTVPVTDDAYCTDLIVVADRNPLPLSCTFRFGPDAGAVDVAVRLRLIESMRLRALARMSDGRVLLASAETTVAAGGCGM
ncbi:MAG: thiosulfate oxidation carrier protein SoxY [Paracoccus sp. (in: a-proteobacteria)]|nr:thiosulfate oxidation carrier protein SoxY [Paracoccus sp. (in: a-proteobacteria)]